MVRGIITYVPPNVMAELNAIIARKNITGRKRKAQAFKEMAKYSKIGREAENIFTLRFN